MFHFNKRSGFSLIELMVVMAILAVVMSLSGGLFQKSIDQQERHIELEKLHQIFKQLSYQAYYQGKELHVRLEENKLFVYSFAENDISNESDAEQAFEHTDSYLDNQLYQQEVVYFKQLIFVARDFLVTTKGVVSPNEMSVFINNNIVNYSIEGLFTQYE
ncbi:type II secretion system protein [Colwellia sp. MEBiC06753]